VITLSVVVPVRDGEPFLDDALTSLVRNVSDTFRTEVIVVDDGSVDATPEVIEDFRGVLPGLTVIRNPIPVGLADARNLGLKMASGRYVTFLDGDDWLAPGYLGKLVSAIDGLACDFVRADHVQVEGRKRETHRAPEAKRNVVLDPRGSVMPAAAKTMVDYPYAWAGIYRRSMGDLLVFPSGLHTAEDRPWIWRLHQQAKSFAVVSLAGVFYRRGLPASLTQIGDERQLHFFDAFEMVLSEVEDQFRPKALRTFCALLANHQDMSARFTPEIAARFATRSRAALAGIPGDQLAAAIAGFEPERQATLLSLKEGS
jgi:glycosyltransferase involved in cell wall biosynthesis